MKTIVACFLGLVALVTFSGGSPVYADEFEADASALSVLAPDDAGAYGVASLDDAHCVLYSDGADNCIVNVQPEVVDEGSTTFTEIDPVSTEEAPAIRFLDAIPVAVVQTVTIAAPGLDTGDREEASSAQPMPLAAPEPIFDRAETTTGALVAPATQSADAIVVAIVQSATVAVSGQSESGGEEAASAELQLAPAVPISTLDAKATARDNAE